MVNKKIATLVSESELLIEAIESCLQAPFNHPNRIPKYFDPMIFDRYFNRLAELVEVALTLAPGDLLGFSVTPKPRPTASTSFDGRGYHIRSDFEHLLEDVRRLRVNCDLLIDSGQGGEASSGEAPDGKVFVVHGRNDDKKAEVCACLESMGLEPIVLHQQPNLGLTLIEKFESNADVHAAVVLMGPEDSGHWSGDDTDNARPRARQNVVLEFGYFMGKLGRDRVIVLVQPGDVELPTDILGVVYVEHDDQSLWQEELHRELLAAGLPIES